MKPLKVYVAGKYSAGNTIQTLRNIGRGQKMCTELFVLGFAPFCPWDDAKFLLQMPDIMVNVRDFFNYTLQWLEVSDCMLVISGKEISEGVKKEINFCNECNIPIFYSLSDLMLYREKLIYKENFKKDSSNDK